MTSSTTIEELISEAELIELSNAHDFNQLDRSTGLRSNHSSSPKKSQSGLYFLTCRRCGRCLFEGRSDDTFNRPAGSAAISDCR